jgi:hypothetical protein
MTAFEAILRAVLGHKTRTQCEDEGCRHFGQSREDNVPLLAEEAAPVQGKRRGRTSFMRVSDMALTSEPGYQRNGKRRGKPRAWRQ